MIFPSITTLILGVAVFAALAVLDWYVWGMTYANSFRYSRPVKPCVTAEAAGSTCSTPTDDERQGFSRVA